MRSYYSGVLRRSERDTERGQHMRTRGGGHRKTEAELELMEPQPSDACHLPKLEEVLLRETQQSQSERRDARRDAGAGKMWGQDVMISEAVLAASTACIGGLGFLQCLTHFSLPGLSRI